MREAKEHEPTSVRRTVELDCSADELWHLVTDASGLGEWLGRDVELDPRPGARGRLLDDDGSVRHLLVREVVDGRRFGFSWWAEDRSDATDVSFTIEPAERGGSQLTVTETLPAGPLTGSWELRLLSLWLSVCALARV